MYVWGRLSHIALKAAFVHPCQINEEGQLHLRCHLGDVDTNFHINNARYMMLADLGRVDIYLRSGLLSRARKQNCGPIMGGLQTVFKREIRIWQKFQIVTKMDSWRDRQLIAHQNFLTQDGTLAASIITSTGFYDNKARRFIPITQLFDQMGFDIAPRPLDDGENRFLHSYDFMRNSSG